MPDSVSPTGPEAEDVYRAWATAWGVDPTDWTERNSFIEQILCARVRGVLGNARPPEPEHGKLIRGVELSTLLGISNNELRFWAAYNLGPRRMWIGQIAVYRVDDVREAIRERVA